MRSLTVDQRKRPDDFFGVALGDGERHRVAFNFTDEPGRMAVRGFIPADWPAVLSDVRAAEVEAPSCAGNNLLVYGSVSAIILDLTAFSSDLKADVVSAPSARARVFHVAVRQRRLTDGASLLSVAVACEES